MSFIKKLQNRWSLSSKLKVWLILVVFACTGTTIYLAKPYVLGFFNFEKNLLFDIIYFILIWPIYNIVLLIYGAIFGLFDFFWSFEKRMFNKLFRRKK